MTWSPLKKISFLFIALYFFIFTMSNQFFLSFAFEFIWKIVVPWFGENIFQITELNTSGNGSGDTAYNWLSLLVYAIISLIGALIIFIADRSRPNYEVLLNWLVVLIRYYVIYQMILYGLAKVFYLQFQPPRFARLIQPYGDSSPMGLLWTFMGFSKPYTIFAGLGEVAGGLLLLTRKTQTLGALIVFGVMSNVMAMNFFYDVPVKILSSHLVLLSLFLLFLDRERLWNFFFKNKDTNAKSIQPMFANPDLEKAKNIIKWLLVSLGFGAAIFFLGRLKPNTGDQPKLYGLYEVEEFKKNGEIIPPLLTDSTRWRYFMVEWEGRATVKLMDDSSVRYRFNHDSTENKFVYFEPDNELQLDSMYYNRPDSTHLQFDGFQNGDTLKILMKSIDKKDFRLMNRGFNWVNESPFNR